MTTVATTRYGRRSRRRARLRLGTAAAAGTVALAMVLTACGDGGGSGRRGHGSSGGGGSDGGSSVGKDDDDDFDIDDDDLGGGLPSDDDLGTDNPAPTGPSSVALASIVPDMPALAGTHYTTGGQPTADAAACGDYPEVCATATDRAQVAFATPAEDDIASFQVLAFPGEAEAGAALELAEDALAAEAGYTERERDAFGDASIAYDVGSAGATEAQVTVVQVGPYVGAVARESHDGALLADWQLADALTAMFEERMSQAESGQQPSATVEM